MNDYLDVKVWGPIAILIFAIGCTDSTEDKTPVSVESKSPVSLENKSPVSVDAPIAPPVLEDETFLADRGQFDVSIHEHEAIRDPIRTGIKNIDDVDFAWKNTFPEGELIDHRTTVEERQVGNQIIDAHVRASLIRVEGKTPLIKSEEVFVRNQATNEFASAGVVNMSANQLLITTNGKKTTEDIQSTHSVESLGDGILLVNLGGNATLDTTNEAAKEFEARSGIQYIEPNYIYTTQGHAGPPPKPAPPELIAPLLNINNLLAGSKPPPGKTPPEKKPPEKTPPGKTPPGKTPPPEKQLPSEIQSPKPGSALNGARQVFSWSKGGLVKQFKLKIGTKSGGDDLFSRTFSKDTTSQTPSNLPVDGRTLYVTLSSLIDTRWYDRAYYYIAAGGDTVVVGSELTEPAKGGVLKPGQIKFAWTKGQRITKRWLKFGSRPGRGDYYSDEVKSTNLSLDFKNYVTDKAYVTLESKTAANTWIQEHYVFDVNVPTMSKITSPAVGSTITDSAVTFTWDDGEGIRFRYLDVKDDRGWKRHHTGFASGGKQSVTINLKGQRIKARLYSNVPDKDKPLIGTWKYSERIYNTENRQKDYDDQDLMAGTTPNDPSYNRLWGMNNPSGTDIDAPEGWARQTGNGEVLVGIIDTGFDYNHPDLKANAWTNPGESGKDAKGNDKTTNGIDDDKNGYVDDFRGWDFVNNDNDPMDDNKHGTHCGGTIGGVGNNGIGVAGVSWKVKMVGLKFLSGRGSGSLADAVKAINYATKLGVDLTSNSWGGGGASSVMRGAIQKASDAGIMFIAAAGNAGRDVGENPTFPACYRVENVIAVASAQADGKLSGFSNYGKGSKCVVQITAPGSAIYSTIPGNRYGSLSGTSMATPAVSGAVALMLSQDPSLTVKQIRNGLIDSSRKNWAKP